MSPTIARHIAVETPPGLGIVLRPFLFPGLQVLRGRNALEVFKGPVEGADRTKTAQLRQMRQSVGAVLRTCHQATGMLNAVAVYEDIEALPKIGRASCRERV